MWVYNLKNFLCILISIVLIVSFASCNALDGEVFIKPIIAVETNSNELYAAKKYCSYNEAEIFEYSSVYDAVVAVENGKADYVVLDEYTATTVIDAGVELELYEDTTFSMEFCAYFSNDNDVLSKEFDAAVKKLIDNGTIEHIVETHKKGGVVSIPVSSGEKGELSMLCDPIFENTLYYNSEGEIAGVDLDIARAICAELGYTLTVSTVDFEELFLSLESGDGDFIMSSLEYTEERAENYCASEIYNSINYSLYKRK